MDEQCTLIIKQGDKEITKMEISPDKIKATQAAALGLAQPRNRKPNLPQLEKKAGK